MMEFVKSILLAAARRAGFSLLSTRKTRPFGTPLKGFVAIILGLAPVGRAGTITITVPADLKVEKVSLTTEKEPRTTLTAKINEHTITFDNPESGMAYEAQLTLSDGTVLQGVDMGWYSRVPDKANAGPLTDDDRDQMKAVFTAGAQFFNVQEATIIQGNHNRAVMLVRLERANFHSDKGGEIIWRPELWYFQNEHGGWEKVLQTDRVLRRERFASPKAYHDVVDKLKWVPELGGLKSTPKTPDVNITLPANAGVPTAPPTSQPTDAAKP